MAKRYDPIMCMMVDEPTKAQDAEKLHYYQHSYTKKWYVVSPDGKVFKEFNTEAEAKNYVRSKAQDSKDSAKAKDESEKYAVIMKNSSGKEQHTQGWDLGSIRNWIKDNEKRGYRVTWKNFDSKTIDKAQDSASALDEAISTCDAASGDAMKQIANTAKAWAKQYNQLFEKATTAEEVKKLKSQKDNDYRRAMDNLDKIYNEVSQEYGRARSEVRDLFDEVDSNGFKAYQRVTQK